MKWPELIDDGYVRVALDIKHPKFGILHVDRFQRKKEDMQSLMAETDPNLKILKYNSDYHTIVDMVHFPENTFEEKGITYKTAEFYTIYVDWTGY